MMRPKAGLFISVTGLSKLGIGGIHGVGTEKQFPALANGNALPQIQIQAEQAWAGEEIGLQRSEYDHVRRSAEFQGNVDRKLRTNVQLQIS